MVSMLATGPKVCGLKPGRGDGFLRVLIICSTPSFGGEVKLETPCHKILWRVKTTCKYEQKYFKVKFSVLSPIPPICYQMSLLVGMLGSSGGRVRSLHHYSTMVLHVHASPGGWTVGPLVTTVQKGILTLLTWPSSTNNQLGTGVIWITVLLGNLLL
jgi:hypothetical protein